MMQDRKVNTDRKKHYSATTSNHRIWMETVL